MQLKWSHAFVNVRDLESMLDFYTGVLGFEVTDRGELNGASVAFISQVPTDHHQLAFLESDRGAGEPNRVGHFAFRVDGLDDVVAMRERLQADGRVANIAPVTHGNAWSIYFADPEGNGIEVFCDTPFHVKQPMGGGWDPAASREELLAAIESEHGGSDGFRPIEDFYRERAEHLAQREGTKA